MRGIKRRCFPRSAPPSRPVTKTSSPGLPPLRKTQRFFSTNPATVTASAAGPGVSLVSPPTILTPNCAAAQFGVSIVGGETSDTPGPAALAVTVAGFVEKNRCVLRSGGKPGDDVFVTGRLGGALRGKHLRFIPRIRESRWLTENFHIRAMIDLS